MGCCEASPNQANRRRSRDGDDYDIADQNQPNDPNHPVNIADQIADDNFSHPVNMYGSAEPKDDDFYKRPPDWHNPAVLASDEVIEVYEYPIYKYKTERNKWSNISDVLKRDLSSIGIVTQCSMDRLPQLEAMCFAWNGLISVTIYTKNDDDDILLIDKLFNKLLANNSSIQLQIHLVYENKQNEYYPINYLRNVSLNNCLCDYVFLLDIDFVCSRHLYSAILNNLLSLKDREVFVIPAFELNFENQFDHKYHPLNKDALISKYNSGEITAFHSKRFSAGHHATNYSKWMTETKNYKIKYENHYEPYVVVKNDANLCRYDERFNGYGMNKIIHIAEMAIKEKYEFMVFNDGFVTASKHELSNDYKRTFRTNSRQRKKWLISLYNTAIDKIQKCV